MIETKWTGRKNLNRFRNAIIAVGNGEARKAIRNALNHTGDKTFTQVKRAVAKQVGLTQAAVLDKGGIRKIYASSGKLEYCIKSTGRYLPLKYFKPRQLKAGVKASPWGKRQLFRSTYIVAKSGEHVFKTIGGKRGGAPHYSELPIEKLYGPAVPKEIVREESKAAFERTLSQHLPRRIAHELKRATKRVFG